jgi:hypothetical protein
MSFFRSVVIIGSCSYSHSHCAGQVWIGCGPWDALPFLPLVSTSSTDIGSVLVGGVSLSCLVSVFFLLLFFSESRVWPTSLFVFFCFEILSGTLFHAFPKKNSSFTVRLILFVCSFILLVCRCPSRVIRRNGIRTKNGTLLLHHL